MTWKKVGGPEKQKQKALTRKNKPAPACFFEAIIKTRIPNRWITRDGLPDLDDSQTLAMIRLYFEALRFAEFDHTKPFAVEFPATGRTLSGDDHKSERHGRRLLVSLQASGYLERCQVGAGARPSTYRFTLKARRSAEK